MEGSEGYLVGGETVTMYLQLACFFVELGIQIKSESN